MEANIWWDTLHSIPRTAVDGVVQPMSLYKPTIAIGCGVEICQFVPRAIGRRRGGCWDGVKNAATTTTSNEATNEDNKANKELQKP